MNKLQYLETWIMFQFFGKVWRAGRYRKARFRKNTSYTKGIPKVNRRYN